MGLERNSVGLCIHPQFKNKGDNNAINRNKIVRTNPQKVIAVDTEGT
ncbi:conserved hypothetical protein [Planktothrix rubescens CCAP 1459/22]|uniref:Uncharacterized protein n=1 Tax=Planktothrix rubescens CCAP 1459/22 TaxID=329571 RepID=A0A6J7ZN64_PLARU|nr:conserved hypothetical protein [Planktothrix rubescens NIVA-CYA 18]